MEISIPRTDAEWAAHVAGLDGQASAFSEKAFRSVSSAWPPAPSAPWAPSAPTIDEINEIIRNASVPRGSGRSGLRGVSGLLEKAQGLIGNVLEMIDDPLYTVAMMVLIMYTAGDPWTAIVAARDTVLEIAAAAHNVAVIEDRARAAFSRFFVPMSEDKKSDALACLLYACGLSAVHVASAMGAALGEEAPARLGAAFAGLAGEYTQVDDIGLCAPVSMERETYSGVTDGIAAVAQVERAMRLVPAIAALVRQGIRNEAYMPHYADKVDALIGAVKALVVSNLPEPARALLEEAREYKKTRLLFYLLVAVAFGYSSFLYAMLMLESPLCARIVANAAGNGAVRP
jgi:hypothetical protein